MNCSECVLERQIGSIVKKWENKVKTQCWMSPTRLLQPFDHYFTHSMNIYWVPTICQGKSWLYKGKNEREIFDIMNKTEDPQLDSSSKQRKKKTWKIIQKPFNRTNDNLDVSSRVEEILHKEFLLRIAI